MGLVAVAFGSFMGVCAGQRVMKHVSLPNSPPFLILIFIRLDRQILCAI